MCDFIKDLFGMGGKDKPAVAADPQTTGRQPGQVKSTEAVIKNNENSDLVSSATDIAVKKSKKNSARGVPGLNL